MQNSVFIAKLIGPTIAAMGLTMVINRKAVDELANDMLRKPGAIIMLGILTLLAGLAVVNTHNIWVWGWPVVITIFGWAAVVGGLIRIVLPGWVQQIGAAILKQKGLMTFATAVWIGFGLWLSYLGYLA